MKPAVEVALPAAVQVERLMGSAEGFGGRGSSGGVVVSDVPRQANGAYSSGVQKEKRCAASASKPVFWNQNPNSELCMEVSPSTSLCPDDASKNNDSGNTNPSSLTIDVEARVLLQKSYKVAKSNNWCTKRSGMLPTEIPQSKHGVGDIDGSSSEIASSMASCNISEKAQLVKQKNISNNRRGEKRNSKILKSKSDLLYLKNGLVGLNTAAGGNNFLGVYGLKPDVFDITKYVNELSLDELLHGNYNLPSVIQDKVKKGVSSNNNLLQSVRKVFSVLQTQKVSRAQKCAEVENICMVNISVGPLATITTNDLLGSEQGECCHANSPPSDKAEDCGFQMKTSNFIDHSLPCHPKDILEPKAIQELLVLPPLKDLDLLLSDPTKVASSPKSSKDPRLGKAVSHRTGLAPFPWSHTISGHNRLGAESFKSSAHRPICHGRWAKVKNSTTLNEGSSDFLVDFETLKFDQRLVPMVSSKSQHLTNGAPPIEQALTSSGSCSTFKVHAGEELPTYAAAQTLCVMAADSSRDSLHAAAKLLKKSSYTSLEACKLKATKKLDKLSYAPKPTMRPINPVKIVNDGSLAKKPRLSSDGTSAYFGQHTDSERKGPPHSSASQPVISPPRKLFRHSNNGVEGYRTNPVKTPYTMKLPSSSQQKLRKVVSMKCIRPEG